MAAGEVLSGSPWNLHVNEMCLELRILKCAQRLGSVTRHCIGVLVYTDFLRRHGRRERVLVRWILHSKLFVSIVK
jgi:hypothetical protein